MVYFGPPHCILVSLLECSKSWVGDSGEFCKEGKRTEPVGSVDVNLTTLAAASGLGLLLDPSGQPGCL